MLYAFWAAMGWCGTPWRRFPPPRPDPEPWWLIKILAVVGGLAGGFLVRRLVNGADNDAMVVIATGIGALAVGRVFSEIAGGLAGGRGGPAVGG